MKKLNFTLKLARPHCRTPIKPVQKHKIVSEHNRKVKHPQKLSRFLLGEQ